MMQQQQQQQLKDIHSVFPFKVFGNSIFAYGGTRVPLPMEGTRGTLH